MEQLPLRGLRVIEFGGYIAGPYATSILCSLGADVIKIERPGPGDDFRRNVDDASLYFKQYNAGKRSLAVNLKSERGVALVKALVPTADAIVENMRPGRMTALGLGPEELTRLKPDLIYTSVTGFGEGGPMAQRPAYDMIGQAFGGLVHTLSDAGNARLVGTCLADLVTGLSTATGVLAALVGNRHTVGWQVDTSITEAVSTLTIDAMTQLCESGIAPTRQSRHPQALNFCLRTADDQFIVLHLSSSEKFWRSLTAAIERPDLLSDPRFGSFNERMADYAALTPILELEFVKRPAAHWHKLLLDFDVPFAPALSMDGFRRDEQVQWLDLLEPESEGVQLVRVPWRFGGERPQRTGSAPRVGQHSREIAVEVMDAGDVDALIEQGVLFSTGDHHG
ncbi:CaiB/BaiF CoA transferase family protein [Mycobacterium sp. C31M]